MSSIGLHGGQIFLLVELWKEDGLRQIDLAKRLSLAAPTVHKMLKGQIEINLITCSRQDADARSTRVFLTDLGYRMRDDVEEQWLELEQNSLAKITETERLVLYELLGKLRSAYTGIDGGEDEEE